MKSAEKVLSSWNEHLKSWMAANKKPDGSNYSIAEASKLARVSYTPVARSPAGSACRGKPQGDCTDPCHWVKGYNNPKTGKAVAAHCSAKGGRKASSPKAAKPQSGCRGKVQDDCTDPCHWVKGHTNSKTGAVVAAHCSAKGGRKPGSGSPKAAKPESGCRGKVQDDCTDPCHWVKGHTNSKTGAVVAAH